MSYHINVTGKKADALAQLNAQAGNQRTYLPGDYERGVMDKAVAAATEQVNQFAGEHDSVSITVSGHSSQTDQSFGIASSYGVTIAKGQPAPVVTEAQPLTTNAPAPAFGTTTAAPGAFPAATTTAAPASPSRPEGTV